MNAPMKSNLQTNKDLLIKHKDLNINPVVVISANYNVSNCNYN
jgi:hypothetical protein